MSSGRKTFGFDHVERVRRVKWEVLSFGSVDLGNGRDGKKKILEPHFGVGFDYFHWR
jgi:hypothetical protein